MSSHGFLNNIAHISTLYTYFPLETSTLFPSGSVMTAIVLTGALIGGTEAPRRAYITNRRLHRSHIG